MSPVNIYRPRGFAGGYDHRFVKPFQSDAGGTPSDPLAHVKELHFINISLKPHGRGMDARVAPHGAVEIGHLIHHAIGIDLEVFENA